MSFCLIHKRTTVEKFDDKLCVSLSGETPEDEVRMIVLSGEGETFMSADVADEIFVYENTLLYKIGKTAVAQVDFK